MNCNNIADICKFYGVDSELISDVIDTSRGKDDIRYHYIINKKFVLKVSNSNSITEIFLQEMKRLITRYRNIDIWCPNLILNTKNELLTIIEHEGRSYYCYMEEFAPYHFLQDNENLYESKKEILPHLGKLAVKYSGIDLSSTYSMWSIIDLAPFDLTDEKQENLNLLVENLKKHGYLELGESLLESNKKARNNIFTIFRDLPRCVYQGDLNPTNILVNKENRFVGIIDFNMFGTEVNINCFLNECMYYLTLDDFQQLDVDEIFTKMNYIQNDLLQSIFEFYKLNTIEKKVFKDYKKVIDISFYPNVMLWIYLLNENKYINKVVSFIEKLVSQE